MSKIKPGSKANATLNGEWAKHVRNFRKKMTSGIRRGINKKVVHDSIYKNNDADDDMN